MVLILSLPGSDYVVGYRQNYREVGLRKRKIDIYSMREIYRTVHNAWRGLT